MGSNISTDDKITLFKKEIFFDMMMYKKAKYENDFDKMCDAVENLKSSIKDLLINKNKLEELKEVEKLTEWYRRKEELCMKPTPEGMQVVFPPNMKYLVNKALTGAFEILVKELRILGLI